MRPPDAPRGKEFMTSLLGRRAVRTITPTHARPRVELRGEIVGAHMGRDAVIFHVLLDGGSLIEAHLTDGTWNIS